MVSTRERLLGPLLGRLDARPWGGSGPPHCASLLSGSFSLFGELLTARGAGAASALSPGWQTHTVRGDTLAAPLTWAKDFSCFSGSVLIEAPFGT